MCTCKRFGRGEGGGIGVSMFMHVGGMLHSSNREFTTGKTLFLFVCLLLLFSDKSQLQQGRASQFSARHWGAADAEIKVPSVENTELNGSPFKTWYRSIYSRTCYAYCQEFLPRLFLPFRSIYLHFFQILSQFFPVLAVANSGSCVGPQNKIGHPVECRFPCLVPAEYKLAKNMTCGMMTSEMNDLDIE